MTVTEQAIETLNSIRNLKKLGKCKKALEVFDEHENNLPMINGAYYLKGTLHQEIEDDMEALRAYKTELARNPKCSEAHINMGVIYYKKKMFLEAIASFKLAILTAADQFLPYYNLAGVMQYLERNKEAIVYYQRACAIKPDSFEAWLNLSILYKKTDEKEKAIHCYQNMIRIKPECKSTQHILEALSDEKGTITKAENEYIELLFDSYAPKFEKSLLGYLKYRIPQTVKELLEDHCILERAQFPCDLGCGTGLSVELLNSKNENWIGVDLSQNMLDVAEKKGIYKELVKNDVESFLIERNESSFDLILGLDLLPYFGELNGFFENTAKTLLDNGILTISIERDDNIQDYFLGENARFLHSSKYVLNMATHFGLECISRKDLAIRYNEAKPVDGTIFVFKKKPNKAAEANAKASQVSH